MTKLDKREVERIAIVDLEVEVNKEVVASWAKSSRETKINMLFWHGLYKLMSCLHHCHW